MYQLFACFSFLVIHLSLVCYIEIYESVHKSLCLLTSTLACQAYLYRKLIFNDFIIITRGDQSRESVLDERQVLLKSTLD